MTDGPTGSSVPERIGVYQVVARLGAGAMGEVYRARDTSLERDVAIKILPATLASDPDRLARFGREARILAALNHPNIAAIFGVEEGPDGVHALVLELVDGPTLSDRIAAGPIPPGQAQHIAVQVVEALAAAHERGIVHRDLKPTNIKLTSDGRVKVLDFGLAKAAARGDGADPNALTITMDATAPGTLLGTVPYMSPEQARGLDVDRRTDIWAFGCVLYEMLAGRAAFAASTAADTIAAILGLEPDWSALPSNTPAGVRRLLQRCVEKDPECRLRDIADARADLVERRADALAQAGQLESSLYGRALAAFGAGSPYRLWEVTQLRASFLQYPIIAFLSWKVTSAIPGSRGLLFFFAAVVCILVLITVRVMLLTTGAMERQRLPHQVRRAMPWLRMGTLALTLLLWWMATLVVASHPILATLLGVIGMAEAVAAVFGEPWIERAAFPQMAGVEPVRTSAENRMRTRLTPRDDRARRRRARRGRS